MLPEKAIKTLIKRVFRDHEDYARVRQWQLEKITGYRSWYLLHYNIALIRVDESDGGYTIIPIECTSDGDRNGINELTEQLIGKSICIYNRHNDTTEWELP